MPRVPALRRAALPRPAAALLALALLPLPAAAGGLELVCESPFVELEVDGCRPSSLDLRWRWSGDPAPVPELRLELRASPRGWDPRAPRVEQVLEALPYESELVPYVLGFLPPQTRLGFSGRLAGAELGRVRIHPRHDLEHGERVVLRLAPRFPRLARAAALLRDDMPAPGERFDLVHDLASDFGREAWLFAHFLVYADVPVAPRAGVPSWRRPDRADVDALVERILRHGWRLDDAPGAFLHQGEAWLRHNERPQLTLEPWARGSALEVENLRAWARHSALHRRGLLLAVGEEVRDTFATQHLAPRVERGDAWASLLAGELGDPRLFEPLERTYRERERTRYEPRDLGFAPRKLAAAWALLRLDRARALPLLLASMEAWPDAHLAVLLGCSGSERAQVRLAEQLERLGAAPAAGEPEPRAYLRASLQDALRLAAAGATLTDYVDAPAER